MVQTLDKPAQTSESTHPDGTLVSRREVHTLISREMHSGPLPHADMIAKYEKVLPGSANRIIKMAEKQASHRHGIESRVVSSNVLNERIGMILAFIISFTAIIGGIILICFDKDLQGLIAVGAPLGLQLYNYISKQKREQEVSNQSRNEKTSRTPKRTKGK